MHEVPVKIIVKREVVVEALRQAVIDLAVQAIEDRDNWKKENPGVMAAIRQQVNEWLKHMEDEDLESYRAYGRRGHGAYTVQPRDVPSLEVQVTRRMPEKEPEQLRNAKRILALLEVSPQRTCVIGPSSELYPFVKWLPTTLQKVAK